MSLHLTHLRIADGASDTIIDDGTLVIDGPMLTYAGSSHSAPAPAPGDSVIDGTGRTALPGLINCHTHLTIDEMDLRSPRQYFPDGEAAGVLTAASRGRRTVQAGITTIRDCNAPGTAMMALRAAFERGEHDGPRIIASGPAITATGGHMNSISYEADGPDEVRRGVRLAIKSGADFIKLVAEASSGSGAFDRPNLQLDIDEMAAGVRVAHRQSKKVTAHAVTRYGVAAALDAGVDCIEHGYDLTSEILDRMTEAGTWLVPTLSVHGAYIAAGLDGGIPQDKLDVSRRILDRGLDSVGRAVRAGVNIACGSDAGSPRNPVWDLSMELELLVEAGFSPMKALQAATSRSAALIGLDGTGGIGHLRGDYRADILVVEGDPTLDVHAVRNVAAVFRDGRLVVDHITSLRHER